MKYTMKWCLILVIAIVACGPKNQAKQSEKADFSLLSLEGVEYKLSELEGQVVIIDFWATWCPPCRNSIPTFIRLYDKYHEQGFTILGIGLDDEQALTRFRDQMKIPYPILIGNNDVARMYDVKGIPKTIFIDKRGTIRKTQTGFAPELEASFDALVDSLLKE